LKNPSLFDKTSFEGELNILKTEAYVRQRKHKNYLLVFEMLYRERKFRNHYFRKESLAALCLMLYYCILARQVIRAVPIGRQTL
jgi:hypothetical protein